MESTQASVEPVTLSEVLQLATWNRPRTNDELRDFVSRRESIVGR
ncbi:MAG: hypothetical protein ACOH18_00600 [Candidatus Saccharimonadaceae bacterium]